MSSNLACYNYPMQRPRLLKIVPPGLLAISLMIVYLLTMAPGLTWANSGADGGDLISAAATGGVAHPTGYPLYLLVARFFQAIPIGSLAFRTNLMSAIAATSAAFVVYSLVRRALSPSDPTKYWGAGLASGFAFGLAPLFWSQAVITEVYTLHILLVVLLLYLSESPLTPRFILKWKDILLGVIFGLAMGNHITIVFLSPIILLTSTHRIPTTSGGKRDLANWRLDGRSLLRRLLWMGIGLLVYFLLPLRALSKPPVNWGNPIIPANFVWLVSGKLYHAQFFTLSTSMILERIRSVAAILLDQFGLIGLTIGLIGLIVFFKPTRLYFSMIWTVIAFSTFAIGYATKDAFMYLLPALLCFAIWIGLGLGGLMDTISRRFKGIPILASIVFLLVLIVQAGLHWRQVDASGDARAETFGADVLSLAPPGALVFAQGDQAIFSLWYFHYALRERPDIAIVASELLHFEWYGQTLQATYPALNFPGPYPFVQTVIEANPGHPVCYVQYILTPQIDCLPAGSPLVFFSHP